MFAHASETYFTLADAAWQWVLDQVRWEDGPWIPGSVTAREITEVPWDRDGMHSGVGGLAHVLAEIRMARVWTSEEKKLADASAERLIGQIPAQTDCTTSTGPRCGPGDWAWLTLACWPNGPQKC